MDTEVLESVQKAPNPLNFLVKHISISSLKDILQLFNKEVLKPRDELTKDIKTTVTT